MIKIIKLTILLLLAGSSTAQGLPQKMDTNNQIIEHDGYILSYNEGCEQPNWVRYVLKPSDIAGDSATRKNYFKSDRLVSTKSANTKDYTRSGYDRGHLKPAADESNDQTQMDETFYMTNISPQYGGFNRGMWKRLENHTRVLVASSDSIIVITGGVLDDSLKTIGENNVCVPQQFFKVLFIYKDGKEEVECYLMSNTTLVGGIYDYLVTLNVVEEKSSLRFLK